MLPMHWLKPLRAKMRFNEPLSSHTTLAIGGPADVWVRPNDRGQLRKIISGCLSKHIQYLVIGKGSNILFSERGFKGVVICLDSVDFSKIEVSGSLISCGAGLSLHKLINQMQQVGLAGLEFLAGIPASVGGAVLMNAGGRNKSIGTLVESVTVMDAKGRIYEFKKRQLKFGYRQSNLEKYVILKVLLRLRRASPRVIRNNIAAFLDIKRKTQDLSAKSAGCIFKNPHHRLSAGEMIEACGLKRRRRGGAEVSGRHANYFINRKRAKAKDILYLIDLAQREVKEKFGVQLEPEIKIVK